MCSFIGSKYEINNTKLPQLRMKRVFGLNSTQIESIVEVRLVKDDFNKITDSPDKWRVLRDIYLTKLRTSYMEKIYRRVLVVECKKIINSADELKEKYLVLRMNNKN